MISESLLTADDVTIKAAIDVADPMVLRGVVYHATGDEGLKELKTNKTPGLFSEAITITDIESLRLLRQKALRLFSGYRDGTVKPPTDATKERLLTAMSLVVGQDVPAKEFEFWREELAIEPLRRSLKWRKQPDPEKLGKFHVLVIGAGLGGVGAAVQLKQAGFNFEIIEKNADVGGTWYQNRYPGARVDLPSRIYSHSFAMDYHFDYPYSPQKENEEYIHWCVGKYGLRKHIRFDTEVLELRWNEAKSIWLVRIRRPDGSESIEGANAVISAVGLLDRPQLPHFDGLENYQGAKFHTAALKVTADFAGMRVAVIGTGATGMQLVPDLQGLVKHLTIFQRSPGWVFPIPGYRDPFPAPTIWLNRNMPYYAHWMRFTLAWSIGDHCVADVFTVDPNWKDPYTLNAENFKVRQRCIAYLKEKLVDRPDLIERTLPNYPPMAKRPIMDNGWFDALKKSNVDLIHDDPIRKFTKTGVVTHSGREVPLDLTVFATGFRANDFFWPMEIIGRDSVTISSLWKKDGARAFWGIMLAHMPNLFCIYGPNSNPKNTGPVPYGEMQVRYIMKCLEALVANDWNNIEVRKDVFDAHNVDVDSRLSKSIFLDKRQKSYYVNDAGRSAVQSPWNTLEYWNAVLEPDFSEFHIGKSLGHCTAKAQND